MLCKDTHYLLNNGRKWWRIAFGTIFFAKITKNMPPNSSFHSKVLFKWIILHKVLAEEYSTNVHLFETCNNVRPIAFTTTNQWFYPYNKPLLWLVLPYLTTKTQHKTIVSWLEMTVSNLETMVSCCGITKISPISSLSQRTSPAYPKEWPCTYHHHRGRSGWRLGWSSVPCCPSLDLVHE